MGYWLYIFILGSFNITYNFAFTYSSTLIYNLFFIPIFLPKKKINRLMTLHYKFIIIIKKKKKKQSLAFEAPVIIA